MLTNLVRHAATVHTETTVVNGSPVIPGTWLLDGVDGNQRDGDFGSYWGNTTDLGDAGSLNSQWTSEHTWASPKYVPQINFKLYITSWAGNSGASSNNSAEIHMKIGGVWTLVWGPWSSNTFNISDSTGWNNVTGIRAFFNFGLWSGTHGYGNSHGRMWLYEIQAWAQVYGDIGLRVRSGATTYNIGADPLDPAHKLRICKGGIIYGIPLVDPADASASPVRIFDGTAIKCLPYAI